MWNMKYWNMIGWRRKRWKSEKGNVELGWIDVNRTRDLAHTSHTSHTCHPHHHSLPTLISLKNSMPRLIHLLFYETSCWRNAYCSYVRHFLKIWIWNIKYEIIEIWSDDRMIGW
jgi:hypothetical protein